MIKNAIPEVRELQLDYRKEVDRLLKMTCEAFIRESAHQVVGPLTSVIPKAVSFFRQIKFTYRVQCGNFSIFLSLRFYVKSIVEILEVLKMPFFVILETLHFDFLVHFSLQKVQNS